MPSHLPLVSMQMQVSCRSIWHCPVNVTGSVAVIYWVWGNFRPSLETHRFFHWVTSKSIQHSQLLMWKWCFQMFHRIKFTYYLYVPKTRFCSLSFVSHVQKANYPRKDFHMKAHMTDRNSQVMMLLTRASYPAWSLLVKWLYEMGSCFKFWFLFGLSSYFSIMGWIQRWNCIQMHTSFGIKSLKQPIYSWTTIHHLRIVERSTKCNSNWQEHHPGTHKLLCGCCKDFCSRVGALEEHKQNAF